MIRTRRMYVLVAALAACAGASPQGPASASQPMEPVRPNIYEVTPEQVAGASVVPQQAPQEAPFIEVNGQATVELPADRAQISFAMETHADNAATAASSNATEMSSVIAGIRATGLAGLEVETFGYSLQPQYSTNDQRVRSIIGYVAHNNIRVTISDVNSVGRLIDAAVAAGANRVASISFSASDTEGARAQALAEAVRNARTQAESIATALGYELGAPLEIRGGAQRPGPIIYDGFAQANVMRAQAVPTPIEAGSQTVDANVTIRFALGREVASR